MVNHDATRRVNEHGQPIGFEVVGWTAPPFPPRAALIGRYCRLEPVSAANHARDLWDAQAEDATGSRWTYSYNGPFARFEDLEAFFAAAETSRDPQHYAILVDGRVVGMAAYLRIDPQNGVIEVGHIYFAPRLAKTRAATEAIYLLMSNAFSLGYRRFEWKCDSCNLPSRAAAARFGFTYEGKFRQAIVYKGRNRDTTWFAILDVDWNAGLRDAYLLWLGEDNFDAAGRQRRRLSELTAPFVHARS
jgi:RimJ/RimL family protein N-acetyltransferase